MAPTARLCQSHAYPPVIRGNGLQLHFQDPTETITLPTLEQATFPGDRPLTVIPPQRHRRSI
ncbi:MAG: hypothetical protein R2932_34575 [Caldilineaceae bacterium]